MTAGDYTIDMNGVRVVSCRVTMLWRGAWWAELDIDPDSNPVTSADVPAGAVTITIAPPGGTPFTLKGTVDPASGGRFVSSVKVVVLAGGGGWSTPIEGQHFQNENGVSSLTVENATAALVGETVNDPAPVSLGTDWVRIGSTDEPRPASAIFGDRQWYVDPAGVTQVQAWPPDVADSTLEILQWDPQQQLGRVACDALVLPGTQLTDSRFDGPITVRDVEMTFNHKGSRAWVWCSAVAVTRLMSAMSQMVRTFGKLTGLARWTYTIVSQSGATLNLQAAPNADGTKPPVPDTTSVVVWPGLPGMSAIHTTASKVGVVFMNGDYSLPRIVDFDGTPPIELTLDATSTLHLGPNATVKLAEQASDYAAAPVAGVGDSVMVLLPPLCPVTGTVGGAPFVGVMTVTQPCVGSVMSGASKVLR